MLKQFAAPIFGITIFLIGFFIIFFFDVDLGVKKRDLNKEEQTIDRSESNE